MPLLQGRVRVHGGRRGTKDLGPGEHFHRRDMRESGQGMDAFADSASVASPHAVLFIVNAAHISAHDRPGTAQVREALPEQGSSALRCVGGGPTVCPCSLFHEPCSRRYTESASLGG